MCVARHNAGCMLPGQIRQSFYQGFYQVTDFLTLPAQIQSQIESNLIVAAAGSVQFFPSLADALRQHLLDKHVNVLTARINCEHAAFQILQDSAKTFQQLVTLALRQDALCREHRRMCHAPLNILPKHTAVKADGGIEVVCDRIGYSGGHTRPHLFHVVLPSPLQNISYLFLAFTIACTLTGSPYRLMKPMASA